MNITDFILRLLLAFVLGSLVGIERQFRQKSAGLRTNTLVSVGAASFMILSMLLTDDGGDRGRIAGQIVTGIGFLGAGVIMKSGTSIIGLNTAATIWCSAAVGSLSGAGFGEHAILVTIVIILIHLILRPIGQKINHLAFEKSSPAEVFYQLIIGCQEQVESYTRIQLINYLKIESDLRLRSLKSADKGDSSFSYLEAQILANGKNDYLIEQLARKLSLEFGVSEVSWKIINSSEE